MDNIKVKSRKLLVILSLILGFMYILTYSGGMLQADDALVYLGKTVSGFTEQIYSVKIGETGTEVLPLIGNEGITQPIYMNEETLSNETLMLGIYMATYNRENYGTLYVELSQEDEKKTYKIEMEEIEDNSEMRLLFDTENFQAGEVEVRLYSLDSTGENCVALYTVDNTDIYSALYFNGEKIERNAVIQVYIPSEFAISEFKIM